MLLKLVRYTLTVIIFSSITLYADQANAIFSGLHYYGGLSVGYQNLSFKTGYGEGFFPNKSIDAEFYFGGQKCNKFGYEFGYSSSADVNQYVRLNPGDKYPGSSVPLAPGTYQVWDPHVYTDTIYFGINRYFSLNPKANFRLFGLIGAAWAKVYAYTNFIDDDLPGPPSYLDTLDAYNSFTASHIIGIFKVGLEYDFTRFVGCRLNYTWKNYASFGGIKSSENPESSAEVRLGNANAVYFGIYVIV